MEGRRVSSGNEYSAKLLVNADRSVTLRLIRVVGGAETVLAGPEDGLSLEDEFELLDTTLPTPGARRR